MTRATLRASSAGSRASSRPSWRRATGTWPSPKRRSYSATTPGRCGTSSCSGSRRAAGAFEPNGSPPRKRGSSFFFERRFAALVALLALDRPGDDGAALAVAAGAGRVLLRTARPVGHREDLERRHLGRRLEKAAIGLGRGREQRPEPLAIEEHRVTQHVHGAGGGLRHDVVLTELVLASLEHPGFLAKPALYLQAKLIPCPASGSARTGWPLRARSALASAGATTGVAGSPTPVGLALEGTMCTSMRGAWFMRSTG